MKDIASLFWEATPPGKFLMVGLTMALLIFISGLIYTAVAPYSIDRLDHWMRFCTGAICTAVGSLLISGVWSVFHFRPKK